MKIPTDKGTLNMLLYERNARNTNGNWDKFISIKVQRYAYYDCHKKDKENIINVFEFFSDRFLILNTEYILYR